MSKIVAGTAFVLLSGATVTGGVLLSKQKTDDKTTYDSEIPVSLSAFKQSDAGKNEGCVQHLFPGLASLSAPTSQSSDPTLDTNFLSTTGNNPKPEGCLVVNWDKKTKPNEATKWSGTIRFLWALKGENKGFLMFLAGTTSNSSDKKLKWEGIVQALALTDGTWSVKKQHEVGSSSSKDFTKSSEDNKFPGPGDVLGTIKDKAFWGLFDTKDSLDNVDEGTDFSDAGKYRGYWKWQGTGVTTDKDLGGWAKNLSNWWTEIFTDSPWNMNTMVQNQKGTWSQVVDVLEPKANASASQ